MQRKIHFLLILMPFLVFSLSLKAQDSTHVYSVPKDSIVENPDQMPEYPGGYKAMEKYLSKHVKYPKEALKNRIQGTVFYRFVVLPDGKLAHITILKDIGGGCGEAGVEVIKGMPLWHPGMLKGKPVPVKVAIPLKFIVK